jgi:hypothetical protein
MYHALSQVEVFVAMELQMQMEKEGPVCVGDTRECYGVRVTVSKKCGEQVLYRIESDRAPWHQVRELNYQRG